MPWRVQVRSLFILAAARRWRPPKGLNQVPAGCSRDALTRSPSSVSQRGNVSLFSTENLTLTFMEIFQILIHRLINFNLIRLTWKSNLLACLKRKDPASHFFTK